ncbi:hypothetical protein V8B55DRAFT_1161390 [Mucor lusitanicus]|uniref:Uncharacterized protein n=1 Tax=Mucor circinelloides f. lusitanicus TaxID=29924 RepID=A0A8H4F069_MUCCL|nr:hypothetical protein FB192DRAFT_1449649 [Mucor lusitanicus]
MNPEEDEHQYHDICSKVNLLSSIQYQQKELSKLAKQLQSEKDREKYTKVIEMSKVIQSKLDYLQQERKRSEFDVRIVKTTTTMDRKNSMWSLQQYHRTSSSSCCSQSSTSDNTTIATNNGGGSQCGDGDDLLLPIVFSDTPARYHTYNGHTYRIVDRVTSLQFKPDSYTTMPTGRRPSTPDTLFENKTICVKPIFKKKQISFSPLPPKHHSIEVEDSDNEEEGGDQEEDEEVEEEEEEEEEIAQSATIHVAVRRDASLFKIEKAKDCQEEQATSTIETNNMDSEIIDEANAPKSANAGLLTPPDSPQTQSRFDREIVSSESYLDLSLHPHIIHVHKKTHSSLKGLLKRSYQLNQYTITKTNSITLPAPSQPSPCFSLPSLLLYKTHNAFTGKAKLLLKVVIVSLTAKSTDAQKRFGFTFMIHHQYQHQQQQDDAKFALAPDSLVKEALATWIHSQNEQHQRQGKRDASALQAAPFLPLLSKSDEILRDGRKLYIVYDTSLFPSSRCSM